ncbi:MAG TPA: SCO family protein [Thermodesulfovibrionales bacterium]|nr:SCO family protein [Thermodesulfovibrionales bacterium]
MFAFLFFARMSFGEATPKYKRTVEGYSAPDVVLVNQDGKKVKFTSLVNSGKPVMLDFIYGTCTTICPVLSAGFSNFQNKLGKDTGAVQLISISIDPEHDTPLVMKDYLSRFRAKPGWDFLTGSREDIDRVMRAFDAYVPNKMAHYPLTLLKAANSGQWVRIYGMVGMSVLMHE